MSQPQPEGPVTPQTIEERLLEMERRLHELQERDDRRPSAVLQRMVPPEVRVHLRAAQRERLLAVRAWVDAAIARVDKAPAERPRRRESVHID